MPKSMNRRELLTFAAVAGAAAVAVPAFAQSAGETAPSGPATPPASAATPPASTEEGVALVSAAYATIGYPLPADQVEEVRKQLSNYPGGFEDARKFHLANGDAPIMGVTPAIPEKR